MPKLPSRILIIKLSALGDIVQTLPVLTAFKEEWPDCRIDWITGEVGAGLLEGHPLLERILIYPRRRLGQLARSPLSWPKLARELGKLRHMLHARNYSMAIDFQGLFKSGLIALLSGAEIRAGFDQGREMSHLFLNKKLPPYDPDRHAVLRYMDLAKALGGREMEPQFCLPVSQGHVEKATKLLAEAGIEPDKFIVLIPGTVWPTKRWFTRSFAELARSVYEELGLKSVVVGASTDKNLGKEIESGSKGVAKDLTGQTDLKTLSALFKLAVTAVSVDTGPMHLAAAAGLPVVAIFGPTAPWRTGPFGKEHKVLQKNMDCSPCFKRSCSHRSCMRAVSPQEVLVAVKELCKARFLK